MKKLLSILFVFIAINHTAQVNTNEFEELANGYYNQAKTLQAAEFYNKAGYAYWNRGDQKKAALMFQKAFTLFSGQGKTFAAIIVSNNLGLIFLDESNYKEAYTAFSNALSFARLSNNKEEIFNGLTNTATVSIETSNYSDALLKAEEALVIAKELNNLRYLAKCYSLLAEGSEKKGDATNAFKYYEMYASIDKKIKTSEMDNIKNMSAEEVNRAQEQKRVTEIELKIKKGELRLTQDSLIVAERLAYERQMQIELRNSQLKAKEVQLHYERYIRKTLIWGIILISVFLLVVVVLLRQKHRDNMLLKQQKEEISIQRNRLDIQNKKITDSIHYGLRIQQAMLPQLTVIESFFESFALFRPKDIVSGDFYWYTEMPVDNKMQGFIAVVDCTGHGVPGAFMSMIGNRLLSEIIVEKQVNKPSQVLEEINNHLRKNLDQEKNKSMDGMDIALCRVNKINDTTYEIVFAGAKRPVHIFRKNDDKIETIEGDHKSIGGFISSNKTYVDKTFRIEQGDLLIMLTDGIIDQPNIERMRFGSSRFMQAINDKKNEPINDIKIHLETFFDAYKGQEEQRDDITVLGFRLK